MKLIRRHLLNSTLKLYYLFSGIAQDLFVSKIAPNFIINNKFSFQFWKKASINAGVERIPEQTI